MATSSGIHKKLSGTQSKSPGTQKKSCGTQKKSPVQKSFGMDIIRSQTGNAGATGSWTTVAVPAGSNRSRLSTCSQSSAGDDFGNASFSSIEKLDSLERSCSSCVSNTGCCSLPLDSWDLEIEKYQKDMPPHIRTSYIDVLILYAEEDRDEVEKFRQHLINDIKLDKHGPIKTWLYDCEHLQAISGGMMGHLAEGVARSTYVFMYLTANFVKDKWMELSSESCLMEAIYNPDKMWCVVPVYTQKRSACNFKIPMGLNTLKGINYYNPDEFYRNGVKKLIAEKIKIRVKNELEHRKIQIAWIEGEKQRVAALVEEQKRLQQLEESQTQMEIELLSGETKQLIHKGNIPRSHQHCSSESSLLIHEPTLSQSASTSSLKSVPACNPAVDGYCKQPLSDYDHNRQNHNHCSDKEIEVIRQSAQSVNQPLQYTWQQDLIKMNASCSAVAGEVSTRSPPISTRNNFKLLPSEGLNDVDISMVLHKKIENGVSEDEKQDTIRKCLAKECYTSIVKTQPAQVGKPHDLGSPHQGQYYNDFRNGGDPQECRSNIPNLLNQQLYQGLSNPGATNPSASLIDSLPQCTKFGDNYQLLPNLQDLCTASYHLSGPVTPGTTLQQQSYTARGSSSNNARSGNIPIISLLENKQASFVSGQCMSSHNVHKMPENDETSVKVANQDAADHETKDVNIQGQTSKPSTVYNCSINVYSASELQIGNSNIVQDVKSKCSVQFSNEEEDDHDDKKEHPTANTRRQNEHESNDRPVKDVSKSIATPSKGHGCNVTDSHREMSSFPDAAAVDAAPSICQKLTTVSIETKPQQQVTNPKRIQSKSQQIQEAVTERLKAKKMNDLKHGAVRVSYVNSNNVTSVNSANKQTKCTEQKSTIAHSSTSSVTQDHLQLLPGRADLNMIDSCCHNRPLSRDSRLFTYSNREYRTISSGQPISSSSGNNYLSGSRNNAEGDGSNSFNEETLSYAPNLETSMQDPETLGFIFVQSASFPNYTSISCANSTLNQSQPASNKKYCVIS